MQSPEEIAATIRARATVTHDRASGVVVLDIPDLEQLLAAALDARAAQERERCARVADNYRTYGTDEMRLGKHIAAAIRNLPPAQDHP